MAADWLGIDSSHLDSHCGDSFGYTLAEALDGTDMWAHADSHTHWFVIDLGAIYNITKVRGRSNSDRDPIDIDIYVSEDGVDWGTAVVANITTWQDTIGWIEIETIPKVGRYVKVDIQDEEQNTNVYFGSLIAPFFTIFDVYGDKIIGTIPPLMIKNLIDPYSGGAWLWLCEIAVSGYDTQRIARNTEDVKYVGKDYDKFNFQVGEQMFSGDGTIPRITLRIFQDRNRIIENIINETEGALGASIKLIRVNENFLDIPIAALEADYDNLAVESDSEWVIFTLGVPNPLTQRFPLRPYSASVCPWATPTLFKGPECQYVGAETTCTGTYDDCLTNKDNAVHWGAELGLDPNAIRI